MNNIITAKEISKNEVYKTQGAELKLAIKYPQFSYSGEGSKSLKKLCKNMNGYYSKIAQILCERAKRILSDKGRTVKSGSFEKNTIQMNYKLSLMNEKIISVVLDIVFESKNGMKKKRFSQCWSVKDGSVIPAFVVFKMTYKTRKKVLSIVIENAKKNSKNPAFGYYSDFSSRLRSAFSLKRFFVTEKGVAFYVDAGVLSDVEHGSFAFVVPYEELEQYIKTGVREKLCGKKNDDKNEDKNEGCGKNCTK